MVSLSVLGKARKYVQKLLASHLPGSIHFHNWKHAEEVTTAAREIGLQSGLSRAELTIISVAALFHDTGYCFVYASHEEISMAIAGTFLKQENCGGTFIDMVMACIQATAIPQTPKNLMEQVLCDADMYHLSRVDYPEYEQLLRREWAERLNKYYTDNEWESNNLDMLCGHQYFTAYGQTVLQPGKQQNIDALKELLE